jgi:hypothetical protein
MDSYERQSPTFEERAIGPDRRPERGAAEDATPSAFMYTPTPPDYGAMIVRDSAAISLSREGLAADRGMVERLLVRLRHVLYGLDEQQHEIVRLRENTRQVLARLSAA